MVRHAWLSLLVVACGPGDWLPVGEGLDEALLTVAGHGADDVWAAGGDVGSGPALRHWDGSSWTRVSVDTSGDLWWVWTPSPDVVWAVGAHGRVVAHQPSAGATLTEVIDPDVTLFGIWGPGDGDIWTVGGEPGVSSDGAGLWRRRDGSWTEVDLPDGLAASAALFKVWGSGASDVWVVGAGGVIGHYDGSTWSDVESPTTRDLFTVHGTGPDRAFAVGGFGTATLLAWDGNAWVDESQPGIPAFPGVYADGDVVWAAGLQGAVWSRLDGIWEEDPRGPASERDLHAVWADGEGGVWTVGGAISSAPLDDGVLSYGGPATPDAL